MNAGQGGSAGTDPVGATTRSKSGSRGPGSAGSASAASGSATPGQMLKQERERRKLTLQEAAEQLNLDRWILEAIEVDHFLALGAPVYARGHLRKYAALLELSQDLIVDRYDALSGTPSAPVVTSTTTAHMPRRSRRERSWKPWLRRLLWLVVVVAVLGVGGWWFLRYRDVGSVMSVATQTFGTPAPGVPATPHGVVMQPLSTPAANQPAAVASNQVSLRLEFVAPAFVEVEDGNGQRLMFENGRAGQTRDLSGTAPLEVIVSVASAVSVKINDRTIVVPRIAGKEATRFSVDPDGTVR